MHKKIKLMIITFIFFIFNITLPCSHVKASTEFVTRISGDNRYETSAKVATTNWTTSHNVVLVSSEGYADAVSASALAKKLDAPILLTSSDILSSETQTALETLKPSNIYIVGGTSSISQIIRDGLKAKYTLIELSGLNRYETNLAVAKELVKLGVGASNVMVVGGEGFADALSVAPIAAAKGQILLLANNNQSSMQPVINFVKDNKSTVTIVGTCEVISDSIKDAFGTNATRVNGGADRFDTNLKVLMAFNSDLKNDKLYIANASPSTPDNMYADALAASVLAGKYTAPIILVDKDGSAATTNSIRCIQDIASKNTYVYIIGGNEVVTDNMFHTIENIITMIFHVYIHKE
ncbi:cell wall-binding repeat-containing protein [Clostridium sp. P21]|uniref:Cell wall-binding repeat-containing protein n=1 Tax=Clostridium muellerianum TaxID=2716538 RepID=A0A7Y0HP95_9CLOT|nr:cell wall-binding repeat-containing protein [Clostridium muellerianum]NMM64784.1 cell wall-binding repeat-containing protein [Clostridium muellerianum]